MSDSTVVSVSGVANVANDTATFRDSNQNGLLTHVSGTEFQFRFVNGGVSLEAGNIVVDLPGDMTRTLTLASATGVVTIGNETHTIEAAAGSDISINADNTIAITEFWNNEVKSITEVSADLSRAVRTWDVEDQFAWDSHLTSYGSAGAVGFSVEIADNGTISAAQVNGVGVDLGAIGGILGSQLGNKLGGNAFTKIAAGTLLGAIGREVGSIVQFGHSANLDAVVNGGITQVLPSFGGQLAGSAVGSLTSLLIAELGDELGLNGFTTGLVSTVGTTITSQLATNAFNVAVIGTNPVNGVAYTMFDGFASGQIFTNMSGAVGAYLGSFLAAQVMMPPSQEAAIGQQIGSSIGGLVGTWIMPGIGSFVGSFVGGLVGTALGELAGNDPQSGGRIVVNAAGQFDLIERWEDHGGNFQWLDLIAHHQIDTAYRLINLTGGRIDVNHSNPALRLNQDDRTFWLTRTDNTSVTHVANVDSPDDLAPLVDPGAMELISKIDLVGGDVVLRRAFENSRAARRRTCPPTCAPKRKERRRKPAGRRRIRQPDQRGVTSKTKRGDAKMMPPRRHAPA